VTFHLEPEDRVYDYEFDFGDNTKQTKSRRDPTIQHSFASVGSYTVTATAQASRRVAPFQGRILPAIITVQHANTPTPDQKRDDGTDWILYVILLVLALLLIAGIYKLSTKFASTPKPSFVSQMDVGGATMVQGNDASLINSELYLNPNIREGLFEIIHGDTGLIHAERSQP
jgi:hypothetical protein